MASDLPAAELLSRIRATKEPYVARLYRTGRVLVLAALIPVAASGAAYLLPQLRQSLQELGATLQFVLLGGATCFGGSLAMLRFQRAWQMLHKLDEKLTEFEAKVKGSTPALLRTFEREFNVFLKDLPRNLGS